MGFDDAYQLGYIKKTHGLQGQVVVVLDVDDPYYYENLESVFLNQRGSLVPFFISAFQVKGTEAIMSLEDFRSKDEASTIVGTELWLPIERLPPLPKGSYYYHDLLGYELYDQKALVGSVDNIFSLPNNYLLGVKHNDTGKEILIPTQEGVIISVDHEQKKIISQLPEGLVDLYNSEE